MHLGGKPSLSREQVRGYKKVWAEFDTHRTGFLPVEKLVPFFRGLTGVLEVRIYPTELSVSNLFKAADAAGGPPLSPSSPSRVGGLLRTNSPSREPKSPTSRNFFKPTSPGPISPSTGPRSPLSSGPIISGMDIGLLRHALAKTDVEELRRRKDRFNHLYHEARLLEEEGKGVSFTDMLLLLAHYKLIDDAVSLELEETIERRAQLEIVEDKVNLERVKGVMSMVWLRRRFLAHRHERYMASTPQFADSSLPSIQIDPSPTQPTSRSRRPNLSLHIDASSTPPAELRNPFERDLASPSRLSPHASPATTPRILVDDEDPDEAGSRRASSTNESFESSAWGAVARRMSRQSIAEERALAASTRSFSPSNINRALSPSDANSRPVSPTDEKSTPF